MLDWIEPLEFAPLDCFRRVSVAEMFPDRPEAPLELDLGCGDGGFLLAMARQHPERNFLGVERLLGRVRKVCRRAWRSEISNVRLLRLETSYTVNWLLPREAFTRIHLLFPDPWPKKKHEERRLVTPQFVRAAADLLVPGGEFLFKSDHPSYFAEAAALLRAEPAFVETDWGPDAFPYFETDFERRWKAEGKPIQGLRLVLATRGMSAASRS
jgi:tRNA (guanine-N7-)-methyltransferase